MKKVAITGMGIISAIGNNVEENLASLMAGRHGISEIENIETIHRGTRMIGEIKLTNEQLVDQLKLTADHNFSRTSLLGCIAAKEAVANAGIDCSDRNIKTGLISATSVGGMDTTEKHYREYFENPDLIKFIGAHDGGDVSQKIAACVGIKGFVTTISTACSSAANAIMLGARMIQSGKLDRVIVGGTDAMAKFTLNGFNSLMILTDGYNQPFDENRKGLNLGEAAGFLVLESEEMLKQNPRKVLGYVKGFGNANDAFHQTASSENGEGAYLAMKKAFEVADIAPSDIDYINVHGTATPNNDLSEGRAVKRIYGNLEIPPFSSTKPFSGHTLAAAAAIEAVYSLLAMQHSTVFPSMNFETPIADLEMIPQTELLEKEINHILSNSFGFGGNCSTLIFSKK